MDNLKKKQVSAETRRRERGFLVAPLVALRLCGLLLLSGLLFFPQSALAHGTEIEAGTATGVQLFAQFDDGSPMANAQVLVYAPDDPETPWLRGEADENGYFAFVPDGSLAGSWDINVRTSGHGDWVYLTLDEGGATEIVSSGGGFTVPQIVLMSAAVIWGFVGTALYFRRERQPGALVNEQAASAD